MCIGEIMNNILIALLALVILAVIYFLGKHSSSGENPGSEEDLKDMNERFLDRSRGRTVIDLVKVFNPSDEMILRSILAAEGVESYVKSNHFGDLYGSAKESIFSTVVISIFEDKTDEGKKIVQGYIRNLLKDKVDGEESFQAPLQNAASAMVGLPASDLKYIPELLI